MARQFTIVVGGVPDHYNAEAIKMTLNMGIRKIVSSRIAKTFVPKTARPVLENLEIIHLEETSKLAKT